jgi:hypothetical protein
MLNEESPVHNYVYSSEIVEFVRVANDYCQFLEELKDIGGKTFISTSLRHLSAVYCTFLGIGSTDPVEDSPGDPTVSEQDWSALFQRIAMLLGPHNDTIRVADEGEFDRSEVLSHTISEDMADVYQELRDFTSIYSRGVEEFMNDAGWELNERFAEHWGKKLLRALSALHELYVKGIDPSNNE